MNYLTKGLLANKWGQNIKMQVPQTDLSNFNHYPNGNSYGEEGIRLRKIEDVELFRLDDGQVLS